MAEPQAVGLFWSLMLDTNDMTIERLAAAGQPRAVRSDFRSLVRWAVFANYPAIRLRVASSSALFIAAPALAQASSSGSARKAALKGSAWIGPS